ncbi:hypothetical protein PBI_PEREGRIN_137 [Rhodococcus phage Peregrin]|nr:hypothetical protein PBI_PEREGRIN_137 [Rhodococcus phage Peregrin]
MKMLGRTYWGWWCCSHHDAMNSGNGRMKEKEAYKSEISNELNEYKEFLDWYYSTKQEREDFLNEVEALNREARELELDNIQIVWQD